MSRKSPCRGKVHVEEKSMSRKNLSRKSPCRGKVRVEEKSDSHRYDTVTLTFYIPAAIEEFVEQSR